MTCSFLIQLVLCKKKTMWFIGVEVEQETRAPPPKKNPGSAPGNVCIYIKNQFQLPLCQIIEVWEEAMLSADQNKFSRLHLWCRSKNDSLNIELAPRKVSFTAWHLGNLYLGGISPKVVSVSPKKTFLRAGWFANSSVIWIPDKTCLPIGK